jgi:hypothetical protein
MSDVPQTTPQTAAVEIVSPYWLAGQAAARAADPWPQRPGHHSPSREWSFWWGYKSVEEEAKGATMTTQTTL